MLLTRRALARAAATIVSATLLAVTTGAGAQDQVPTLKMALAVADTSFNPTTGSVFLLADQMGFFKKHGVQVEFVTLDGTPQAVAALNSGAVDLADITLDSAIRLRADNGVPVRGILATSKGIGFLVAAKNDIASAKDLAGHSFAIADNGSLDHNLTRAMLRAIGAAEPDFVPIGAPDVRVQALAAGRVDATTVSFGTYSSIADTPGIHVIVEPEVMNQYTPAPTKLTSALESTIETKRDAIERFAAAIIETSRAMRDHPDQWADALAAARTDLKRPRIDAISQFLRSQWCTDGCMDAENLAGVVKYLYADPDFKDVKPIPAADMFDTSFADKANETLGPYTPAP